MAVAPVADLKQARQHAAPAFFMLGDLTRERTRRQAHVLIGVLGKSAVINFVR